MIVNTNILIVISKSIPLHAVIEHRLHHDMNVSLMQVSTPYHRGAHLINHERRGFHTEHM